MKMLADATSPSIEKQKSDRYAKNRGIARVVVHVAHRVDVDQGRDERDHQEHDDGQVVDVDGQRDRQAPGASCRPVPTCLRRARPSRSSPSRPAGRGGASAPWPRRLAAWSSCSCSSASGPSCGDGVVREDPLGLDEEVRDEPDQAEHERQADRAGGDVGVQPAEQADAQDLDRRTRPAGGRRRRRKDPPASSCRPSLVKSMHVASWPSDAFQRVRHAPGGARRPPSVRLKGAGRLPDRPRSGGRRRVARGDRGIWHTTPAFARPCRPLARAVASRRSKPVDKMERRVVGANRNQW